MSRETDLMARRIEILEKAVARLTQIETRPRLILGEGVGIVEFIVVSATTIADSSSPFDKMRELTVKIKSPTCDAADTHDDEVKVYEHEPLCLTGDETDEALVGRKGWAYRGVHQDMSTGATAGDLGPCHWVLFGVCCPPEAA